MVGKAEGHKGRPSGCSVSVAGVVRRITKILVEQLDARDGN